MSDCVNSSVGCNGSTTIVGCDGSDIEACLDNILAQANQVCDACFSVDTRLSKVRAILVNMSQFIQDYNTNHNHSASQITSGTLDNARIPSLPASQITSGTLDNARVNWAAPSNIGGTTPANGIFNYLEVSAGTPLLYLRRPDTDGSLQIRYLRGTENRWIFEVVGNETGTNAGSDLYISRYDDTGNYIDIPLTLVRSTGEAVFQNNLQTRAMFMVTGASATFRTIRYATLGVPRFDLNCTNTTETGSNAGSDFNINRFADNGAYLSTPLIITRSSGNASFAHNLHITGALSKGSGSFLIDHPLDTMPDYTLRHEFVEAPRADLIYRGVAEFANNQTEITMSIDASSRMTAGTFVALTQNPVIHVSNNDTWELVRGRVVGGDVVIERKDGRGKLTVDWLVIAERADDFIKTVDYTDEDGRVIPEQRKEALDEDAVMQAIEAFDDDMPEEEVRTRVAELVRGKGNNKMRGVLKDNRSRAKVDELVGRKRKKGKRNEQ